MNKGVLYYNAGSRHGIHLIVSIMTLRDHYKGPVAICCEEDGPGRDVAEACAADDVLGPIKVVPDKDLRSGSKGISYHAKTKLPRFSPFESTIFLDADTAVVGDIAPLWPDPATGEVILTRFADWVSTGKKVNQRIKGWSEVEPARVRRMLDPPHDSAPISMIAYDPQGRRAWPAINTGVLSWSRTSEAFCEDWTHTGARRISFLGDEIAAQLIFPDHNVKVVDCRFNASIVFDTKRIGFDFSTARIVHGHGMKFWKRPIGRSFWLPFYERALSGNRGNIQSLRPADKMWRQLDDAQRENLQSYWGATSVSVK